MELLTPSKIFFLLLVAFIIGIAVASFLPVSFVLAWAFFICSAAVGMFALLRYQHRHALVFVSGMGILFTAGICTFLLHAKPHVRVEFPQHAMVTIRGIVAEEPAHRPKSQLMLVAASGDVRLLVITRPYPEYTRGDRVEVSWRITKEDETAPGNTDSFRGQPIAGTFTFPTIRVLAYAEYSRILSWLSTAQKEFTAVISRVLPEPHASFLTGLLLGERQNFPASLTQALRATGTTHLVALSGYNITIIADALVRMLALFLIPFRWSFFLAISGITIFVLLTGAQASVVRAAIMGGLVLLARRSGRRYSIRNAITAAAAVMLLFDPTILRFDLAFQLSFLATLGLVIGTPMLRALGERFIKRSMPYVRSWGIIRERYQRKSKSDRPALFRDILLSTLAAQLFVLPLLIFRFGQVSLVSPLANLAIIPVIPYAMFFGFIAAVLGMISDFLGRVLALVLWLILSYIFSVISIFSRLPFAAISLPPFSPVGFVIAYILLGFLVWRRWKLREKAHA